MATSPQCRPAASKTRESSAESIASALIGIAEAHILDVFRRVGVPLQRIRPSLDALKDELGPHALASNRLLPACPFVERLDPFRPRP